MQELSRQQDRAEHVETAQALRDGSVLLIEQRTLVHDRPIAHPQHELARVAPKGPALVSCAASRGENDFGHEFGSGVRKNDRVFDHAGICLLAFQHFRHKFFRLGDLFVRGEKSYQVA